MSGFSIGIVRWGKALVMGSQRRRTQPTLWGAGEERKIREGCLEAVVRF